MKRKIYDLVKELLTDYPELRDSDKKLIWKTYDRLMLIDIDNVMTHNAFMEAPSTETIRRCRQKIQELNPELRSSKRVQKEKDVIAKQKGTHVFREETPDLARGRLFP